MKWVYQSFAMAGVLALILVVGKLAPSSPPMMESWPLRPQNCTWLQAAIDAAPEGATIHIPTGICVGNLIVRKSVRLEGSGPEATSLEPLVGFRNSEGLNPIITIESSPGQAITLELLNLTMRQPPQPPQIPFNYGSFDEAVGVQVEAPGDSVSILARRTYWTRLNTDILSRSRLRRLEIRESTFERNFDLGATALEVEIVRNLYIENGSVGVYGQRLQVMNNTVIGRTISSGISVNPQAEGVAEVLNNLVVASSSGISLQQPDRQRVRFIVRKNRLINNAVGIWLSAHDTRHTHFDVLIEENNIARSNTGIILFFDSFKAGEDLRGAIRLRRNHITMSELDYVHGIGRLQFYGNGIDVSIFGIVAWPEEDPLTIELTENRIDYNEKWGIAINQQEDIDSPDRYRCVISGEIDGKAIIPPKIIGRDNIIRENEKGDLCPADYPWPPG
ncbi:MAG: NosD domain-containing protein, partial [Candidatus Caldarchaeum sp.]